MNTKQIIAELRRSACEDENPLVFCDTPAWIQAVEIASDFGWLWQFEIDDLRTFYLLVAEAMEST
jgi:hypothetical protein